MTLSDKWYRQLLTDIKVKIEDLTDNNFSNKSFYGTPWAQSKHPRNIGSTMYRTGNLARSINYRLEGNSTIVISSPLPYASIHNEGGTITVTTQMKKFFWAMYTKATGAASTTSTGKRRNNARNRALDEQASFFKAMALKKVGEKIIIKQRQYVGPHPIVDSAIKKIVDSHVEQLGNDIFNTIKKEFKQQ